MNSALLLETVSSLALQVSMVMLLAAALQRLSRSTRSNCSLWTVAFVSTLMLVAIAFFLPHIRWMGVHLQGDAAVVGKVLRAEIMLAQLAGTIWLVGFVMSALWRIHRYLTLCYFLGTRCRALREAERQAIPKSLRALAPNNTRWLVSDALHGPFCWQLHQPTIVLPLSLFQESEETWQHVLLHECEHLRVGHPVQHFLQGLCVTLFWFHPAVRWGAHNAELAREYWCDEVAARNAEGVASYLRSLAKIAEKDAAAPACTLAFGRRQSAIVRRSLRLRNLANSDKWPTAQRPWSRWYAVAMIVGVIAISQIWLPINVLASDRDTLSPWPTWTANTLHNFGVEVRDYERFDGRYEANELLHHGDSHTE